MDRCQNNKMLLRQCPLRHCAATSVRTRNCFPNCCAEQSPKDNVRSSAVGKAAPKAVYFKTDGFWAAPTLSLTLFNSFIFSVFVNMMCQISLMYTSMLCILRSLCVSLCLRLSLSPSLSVSVSLCVLVSDRT